MCQIQYINTNKIILQHHTQYIMLLKKAISFSISVYDGISPALLATISLSQNIKGKNHLELVQSLKKSNIVQSQLIINSLKKYDRAHFTNVQNPYQNKPYTIGEGQCMTDIFTHSIILNNLEPKLKNDNLKVLDIGTGHGYLSFVIHQMIKNLNINNFQVRGVDCNQSYITNCNNLKRKFDKQIDQTLKFQIKDVNDLPKLGEEFDVIIGGFFIQPNLSKNLKKLLKEEGIGIWPSQSQSGQALFKYKRDDQKFYLIQTLFSQQRVKSSVDQYFVKEGDITPQKQQSKQNSNVQSIQEKLQQRKEQKKILQNLLKQLIAIQKKKTNKSILTLQQMKKSKQICAVLESLKKYK